jgi:hypothetical protein
VTWLDGFILVAGSFITVDGTLDGPDTDPFNFLFIGLVKASGGVGVFARAGFVDWNPTVNSR